MGSRKTILITGISGSLAHLCAERLLEEGHDVVGVDYRRRRPGMRRTIQFYRANYNKRIIADVFKRHRPDVVLHLGRVGNLKTHANKRFDLNVVGSAKIMGLCSQYQVKRVVVLSTFHIYGAHPANHIPIFEDEPLRAAHTFPQLADAVQLDNQALTFAYRYRQLNTAIIRPTNIVGPNISNAISSYLRQKTQAYLLGYSPMWQFIHEFDMVDALLRCLNSDAVGVFNLSGAGEMPLIEALRLTGSRLVPVPNAVASMALKVTGRWSIPEYFLDFMKYPCIISDQKFRDTFDYQPTVGLREAITSTVQGP